MNKDLLLAPLAAVLALVAAHNAQAQAVASTGAANLSFSGGSGAQLTLTLNNPVSYTLTSAGTSGFSFVFQGVGNLFNAQAPSVTGDITYSLNGGPAQSILQIQSGVAGGNIATNDVYITNSLNYTFAVGDMLTLFPGSETTTATIVAAAPTNGFYNTFIADNAGTQVSTFGVVGVVPEPSTYAMLGAGLGLVGVAGLRRQARRA